MPEKEGKSGGGGENQVVGSQMLIPSTVSYCDSQKYVLSLKQQWCTYELWKPLTIKVFLKVFSEFQCGFPLVLYNNSNDNLNHTKYFNYRLQQEINVE